MFISDTTPSNAQTVFLEPVDGTVSSDDTVRSGSAGWFNCRTTSVQFPTMVPTTKLRSDKTHSSLVHGHVPAASCSSAESSSISGDWSCAMG